MMDSQSLLLIYYFGDQTVEPRAVLGTAGRASMEVIAALLASLRTICPQLIQHVALFPLCTHAHTPRGSCTHVQTRLGDTHLTQKKCTKKYVMYLSKRKHACELHKTQREHHHGENGTNTQRFTHKHRWTVLM